MPNYPFFSPRRIFPLLFAFLITACAGPQTTGEDASVLTGRAATSLLAQADSHVQAGEWEQAAALLERALRIEPRNAWLWHHLATVRFRQGRYAQAVSLANKSSSLAPGDVVLRAKNRRLIEQAREAAARS